MAFYVAKVNRNGEELAREYVSNIYDGNREFDDTNTNDDGSGDGSYVKYLDVQKVSRESYICPGIYRESNAIDDFAYPMQNPSTDVATRQRKSSSDLVSRECSSASNNVPPEYNASRDFICREKNSLSDFVSSEPNSSSGYVPIASDSFHLENFSSLSLIVSSSDSSSSKNFKNEKSILQNVDKRTKTLKTVTKKCASARKTFISGMGKLQSKKNMFITDSPYPDESFSISSLSGLSLNSSDIPFEKTKRDLEKGIRRFGTTVNRPRVCLSYDDWLQKKNQKIAEELARRREKEKLKQESIEMRKKKAEEKYKEWLEAKRLEKEKKPLPQIAPPSPEPEEQRDSDETQLRLIKWEQSKLEIIRKSRQKRLAAEKLKREKKQLRMEASARAWRDWEATAASKPKPVPLNRGLLSLRGTVSAIYVNPNEWKSLLEEYNNENSPSNKTTTSTIKKTSSSSLKQKTAALKKSPKKMTTFKKINPTSSR